MYTPRLLNIGLPASGITQYHPDIGIERNHLSIDLCTKEVFFQRTEYIYYNPVAVGLCTFIEEYKYSSAKFYEIGMYDPISDLDF